MRVLSASASWVSSTSSSDKASSASRWGIIFVEVVAVDAVRDTIEKFFWKLFRRCFRLRRVARVELCAGVNAYGAGRVVRLRGATVSFSVEDARSFVKAMT